MRFLLLCVLCCVLSASALEKGARLNYRIITDDSAPKSVQDAADELRDYLQKMYTAPLVINGQKGPVTFYVGFSKAAEQAGFTKPEEFNHSGRFGVLYKPGAVLLAGYDSPLIPPFAHYGDNGNILAVYYFLRRYAGLKVFMPDTERGEFFQKDAPLTLSARDLPVFSFEVRGICMQFEDVMPATMRKFARKRLCNIPFWCMNDYHYLCLNKWNKRFANRPELFALFDGKRLNQFYPRHIPCLTNPEVKKIIVADILEYIRKKNGKVRSIRLFADAPFERCQCENCAKIGSTDDYFYGFILDVTNEVRKVYPEVWCFLQEKHPSHGAPPANCPKLTNTVMDISTLYPEPNGKYEQTRELFEKWHALGAKTTIRLYRRYPQWKNYPVFIPGLIAKNLRAVKGVACGQRYSDQSEFYSKKDHRIHYAYAALTNYVYTSLLLDVDASVESLVREFCTAMYPGAEEEMIQFYAVMEAAYRKAPSVWQEFLTTGYAYANVEPAYRLLAQARKKCRDPYWLNKLTEQFEIFWKRVEEFRELSEYQAKHLDLPKIQAEYRKAHPEQRLIQISSKPVTIPLCPNAIFFSAPQEAQVTFSTLPDGGLKVELLAKEELKDRILHKTQPQNPGYVWNDDNFEIMIAPADKELPYLQFCVNANGALQALRYANAVKQQAKSLDVRNFRASGSLCPEGWRATLEIPASIMKGYAPRGRIAVFRNRLLRPEPRLTMKYHGFSALGTGFNEGNYHLISRFQPYLLTKNP